MRENEKKRNRLAFLPNALCNIEKQFDFLAFFLRFSSVFLAFFLHFSCVFLAFFLRFSSRNNA